MPNVKVGAVNNDMKVWLSQTLSNRQVQVGISMANRDTQHKRNCHPNSNADDGLNRISIRNNMSPSVRGHTVLDKPKIN